MARRAALLLALACWTCGPAHALESVRLQLRHSHQFQFAGYYAALAQGYYRDAGLAVEIREGNSAGLDTEQKVASGAAEYGVGTSGLLLARQAGMPLVVLATPFQHSPFVLLMRDDGTAADIRRLAGKRVMLGATSSIGGSSGSGSSGGSGSGAKVAQGAELLAYLVKSGVALQSLRTVRHSFDIEDLISGKVDAMSAYITNEPDLLERRGVAVSVFSARSAGIDFYGDNLFTSEAELRGHPERVKAFRAASMRGWQYAMDHPQAMVELILNHYSRRNDRAHLLYEARQMVPLLQPTLVEMGYMNPLRWRQIGDVYASLGLLPPGATLDGFLYQADATSNLTWWYRVLAAMLLLLLGGAATHSMLLARERRRARAAIREGERRFRTIFEAAPMGIALIDSVSGQFRDINPLFLAIAGRSLEDMRAANWMQITHPDDVAEELLQMAALSDGTLAGFRRSKRLLRPDGSAVWVDASFTAIDTAPGSHAHHLCMIEDVTEQKQTEALVWQQANVDALTELPNRRMFRDRLAQALVKSRRDASRLAILFIDLDHFKEVNDTLGHHQGDVLLVEAAQRIRACVRASDTVARLGGDEFTVILADLAQPERVDAIAQAIIDSLRSPFALEQEQAFVSASIGITLYPDDAGNIEDLLKHADQAMYAAKDAGRNRYSYFTPALQVAALNRMRLTNDLRGALKAQQFTLHFQPIVHLRSGRIHKAEALIRWEHPTRGLVSPLEFIPLAEASGLIIEIGAWVFHEAARWIARWRNAHHPAFQVSINQSPLEFQREGASYQGWLAHLNSLGLPGQAVVVEITEGLLLDASSAVTDKLLQLRDAGIQVALDDFGTGYSSLSYLKKFDIDYLKIDRSFTRNLAPDSSDMALSEAIIVMAHKLDLQVIAEGVETPEQRDLLLAAGCDYGQGYLFARPMPAETFDALLKAEFDCKSEI